MFKKIAVGNKALGDEPATMHMLKLINAQLSYHGLIGLENKKEKDDNNERDKNKATNVLHKTF